MHVRCVNNNMILSRPRRPSGVDQRLRDGHDAGGLGGDKRTTAPAGGAGNRGRPRLRCRSLRGQRLLAADRQHGDEVQSVEHVLDTVAARRPPPPAATPPPSARRTSAPGTVGHVAPLFVRGQRVQRKHLRHSAAPAHVRGNG